MYSYRRRKQRRRTCLSSVLMFGVFLGGIFMSWTWISQQIRATITPQKGDLSPASAAFAAGNLDGAINAARAIYNAEPNRTDALTLLVRALIIRSYSDYNHILDRQVALQLADAAVQAFPASPDALAARALALQVNGRAIDAYRMAERALIADPAHVLARMALALAYGGNRSFDQALKAAEQVVSTAPAELRYEALRTWAVALGDLGRYQEAGAALDQATQLNPRLPIGHFERALYALQQGDFNTATQSYFYVLSHDPQNAKANLRLCELSTMLRETEQAVTYCQKVTGMAPGWADGWYRLGREYYLQGNFSAAQTYLNRCTRLQVAQNARPEQRHFECWYLQGQAAEHLGDCPALLKIYNEYVSLTAGSNQPQTWTYPPEGPAICLQQ